MVLTSDDVDECTCKLINGVNKCCSVMFAGMCGIVAVITMHVWLREEGYTIGPRVCIDLLLIICGLGALCSADTNIYNIF